MANNDKKLIKDIKIVIADIELVLNDIKDKTANEFTEINTTLVEKLALAKEKLIDSEQDLLNKEQIAVEMTDAYARRNTWKLVMIAALIGYLIGYTVH
ncbi:MAG: DUF883 domain-containing protein [Methylophilaceae bacterium]|jgi:ElaB/YqjD/DUF883 family membrane-anchored ribosome-binding protein|nr:MAG: DUF883 domain-containing protein [Methylophilaceae bacterium]